MNDFKVKRNLNDRMELFNSDGEKISRKGYLQIDIDTTYNWNKDDNSEPIFAYQDYAIWSDLRGFYSLNIIKPIQFFTKPFKLFLFWLKVRSKKIERWGFIDKTGIELIPAVYKEVTPFVEGIAFVKLEDYWSAVDKYGAEIIPAIFDELQFVYGIDKFGFEGEAIFIKARHNDYTSLYSLKGEELTDGYFNITSVNKEAINILRKYRGLNYGYIYESINWKEFQQLRLDEMFKRITTVPYFLASGIRNEYAFLLCQEEGKFTERVCTGYQHVIVSYETGYIIIKGENVTFLISNNGELYETNGDFSINKDNIILNDKRSKRSSLIVLKDDIQIDRGYNSIREFPIIGSKGCDLFFVRKGDLHGLINSKGEIVVPLELERPVLTQRGVYAVKKDKWGFINAEGQIVEDFVSPTFEGVKQIENGKKL